MTGAWAATRAESPPTSNVSAAQASEWVKADGAPLTLIGWSLGGVIARETARAYPHLVREIITMGSPIIGGPTYTALAQRFAGRDFDAIEREIHARNLKGLTQPLTVIYSDRDGIVGPDIAVDIYNSQARNIEVGSTHLGLGINPRVLADRGGYAGGEANNRARILPVRHPGLDPGGSMASAVNRRWYPGSSPG